MNDLTLFEGDKLNAIVKASQMLAKSNVIPYTLKGKTEDIFSILVMGKELDLGPMQSLNSIHVIQGRPAMSAQLMLGLARKRCKGLEVNYDLDEKNLVAKCEIKRQGSGSYIATWDMEKAKALGLLNRDQYKKQPLNMLKWRATTEALRVVCSDIVLGLYSYDEAEDIEVDPIDEEFPQPDHEKDFGPLYRINNGKHRGKQLKDLTEDEIQERIDYFDQEFSKKRAKNWMHDQHTKMTDYLENIEKYANEIIEGE